MYNKVFFFFFTFWVMDKGCCHHFSYYVIALLANMTFELWIRGNRAYSLLNNILFWPWVIYVRVLLVFFLCCDVNFTHRPHDWLHFVRVAHPETACASWPMAASLAAASWMFLVWSVWSVAVVAAQLLLLLWLNRTVSSLRNLADDISRKASWVCPSDSPTSETRMDGQIHSE